MSLSHAKPPRADLDKMADLFAVELSVNEVQRDVHFSQPSVPFNELSSQIVVFGLTTPSRLVGISYSETPISAFSLLQPREPVSKQLSS
jgi:hypothetical protein